MELRIYDKDLAFRGIVDNFTSVIWTRKYAECGKFEIVAPITPENLELLQPGSIVCKRGTPEAGIIEEVINNDGHKGASMTRKGRFLESYFDRRLIKGINNQSGTVESIMRTLIANAEAIPLVEMGPIQGYQETVEFQATYKPLYAYLVKLAKTGAMGWRLRPDFRRKKLVYEVYRGLDRTAGQSANTRVIFSRAYENLNNAVYERNDQNLKTVAYVGGEGEGAERVYTSVGTGSGLGLREVFVDARDLRKGDLTQEVYIAQLQQRGMQKLQEYIAVESFECEVDPGIGFEYLRDWDLGDIGTIVHKPWGIRVNKRITEIMEAYQHGGMIITPTLGDPMPETIDWSDT